VIATSPFLRLAFDPPAWKMSLGSIIDLLIPSLTLSNDLDVTALSRDKKEIEAYQNDPLVHDRVSTRYSLEFMKTGEWAIEHAQELKIPMLLLHGTRDRITSHLASEEFAQKAQGKVEMVLFEGGYHELHHDLDKEKVLETIVHWIDQEIQNTQIT
jgi:alpha-beta hydrolase superfamily lysophospholipase